MGFIGPLFLFGGYVLVYAATAHGGKFATEPWNGVFADAYTGGASSDPSVAAPPAPTLPSATTATRFTRPRVTTPNPPGVPAHGGTF